MKLKSLALYVLIVVSLFSCSQPSSYTPGDTNEESYVGAWEKFFGDTWTFTETSYESTVMWMGDFAYAEKGTLTAGSTTLTITQEFTKETELGEWLASNFDAKFERDLIAYNAFLAENSLEPITSTEYWEAHLTWAQDELAGGTSGSPYDGYTAGMTLEQYQTAAIALYTASLTKTIGWEIVDSELTLTIDSEEDYFTRAP